MKDKLLNLIINMATNHRRIIYISTLLVTLILFFASTFLRFDTRWTELISDSLPVVVEFKKIDRDYLQPGNMIVAISGKDQRKLEKITDEVVSILKDKLVCPAGMSLEEIKKTERYARYVYGRQPEQWLREHMLRLIKPKDAKRMRNIYGDPRLLTYLKHLNDDFEKEYTDSENVKNQERQITASLDALKGFLETIEAAADGQVERENITTVIRDNTIGRPYTFSLDNTMSLVMVASAIPSDDMEGMIKIDYRIEELLLPLVKKYPDYKIERTGITAIGRDEMDSIGPYTAGLTLLAFVLIYFLLVWNFRSFLTPLWILTPIVVGIIWTMGIIALVIGSLNLITSMMMIVLLGLGIDFTIHLAGRFQDEIAVGKSVAAALKLTIGGTGQAVITGALTTAVAFFAIMIAEAPAVRQFGFCAGIGVLLTLGATLWLLPAMLATTVVHRAKNNIARKPARNFARLGLFAEKVAHHRIAVIATAVILTLGGFFAGYNLEWEYNFMNLEPANLRSVELQDEIVDKFRLSITISMLTAKSVEESRKFRKKLKEKRVVGEVNDISQWISRPDYHESRKYIRQLRKDLTIKRGMTSFQNRVNRKKLATELDRLWANLVEIQALAITGGQDRVFEKMVQLIARRKDRKMGMLHRLADRFKDDKSVKWNAVEEMANIFSADLRRQIITMSAGKKPVTLSMVPEDIRAQYTGKNSGDFLMQIMSKKNLYSERDLVLFQDVVSRIDPRVTGMPQLILEMNNSTLREGRIAMLAAVVVIFFVLLLDFRRPFIAFLAFLPLISGFSLTLVVMWLFNEKLNYMNMIALPVIIGIGVDDGVHFMHRYLAEGRDGLKRSATGVGRAILMTTLTTMIGFGSLMFYLFRGIASMGFVLFTGVAMCFIVTIVLLPALIRMFENKLEKGS